MKYLIIFILIFSIHRSSIAQSDSAEISNVINLSLSLISGEKGVERDWDKFRTLFTKDARFVVAQKNKDSLNTIHSFSVDDFIKLFGPQYPQNGFLEYQTGISMEVFNGIAIVFQSYIAESIDYYQKGINSYQLIYDGAEWKIACLSWADAITGSPIPEKYKCAE